MGNGRWSGASLGERSGASSAEGLEKTLEKDSEKSLLWVRALAGLVVLLVAGSVLLGFGSRRYAEKSVAQHPASSIPALSRLSLKSKSQARAILGQLPLIFEPNQGQADPQVKFLAHGAGYSLFLDANSAVLAMQTAPSSSSAAQHSQFVRMKLVGANPAAALAGADALPGKSNYIVGNDPQKWHSGIPQFAGVHYAGVYPGIDLVFYGNQGHLEYDFRVAPGANASQAELEFDGTSKLKLKVSDGDLILTSNDDGGLRLRAPQVYQRDGDRHVPVTGRFVLRAANRVGFEIGPYDRSRELIIDPLLDFSTYFGGKGTETSPSVAVNGDGNIYIVGSTTSLPSQFPLGTTTPTQIGAAPNVFVAKISPSQPSSVVYATFLGGSGGQGADTSVGIGVDDGGNAYIVGNTSSTDFPTFGIPYQTAPETKTNCAGLPTCTSVFVSVLDPAGSALIYSSYLSGNGDDQASGMTIDTKGDVFLTGTTTSQDTPSLTDAFPATYFPVPYQQTPKTSLQFFVTEVDTRNPNSVGGIAYSTYFGGGTPTPVAANCGAPPCNVGGGIAVDATGNMYFSGTTNFFNSGLGAFGDSTLSNDFPVVNAYQPCLDTVPPLILTNPYVCTAPTAPYPTDAFVAKINPLGAVGAQLLFSTYFGGVGNETGPAIAIDSGATHIYLAGETNTGATPTTLFNLPTGIAPFQQCLDTPPPNAPCPTIASPAPFDAYVVQMSNPTQNGSGTPVDVALTYFTYLGGAGNDSASAVAVLDSQSTTLNDVVLTGTTASTNFPTTLGAFQTTLNGTQNAFFSQINTTTTVNQNQVGSFSTYLGGNGVDRGTGIAVDPDLNSYFVGDTTSGNVNGLGTFETKNALQSTLNGTRNAFVVELGTAASLSVACLGQCVSPLGEVSAGNQVTVTFTVANTGPDPATNIEVSGNVPISEGVTFNSATVNSGTCSAPSSNGVVCQIPALQSGALSTVTFVVTPNGICNSCSVTAMVSSANDTNTSNQATASFTAGGYTVSISPPSATVAAGLPGVYAVNLSPTGSFPANVTLSCSALPTGAGCSFTSNTVSFSGGNGGASVTLNLTTTAQPETTISSTGWRHPIYAFWLMVPGMTLLGLGSRGKGGGKKINRLLALLALSVLFGMVLLQPSCSTGRTQPTVSGTPSGTYSLTITATSGTYTQIVPFSLTVVP
ncbi:MAG: SBBP repeat-containing protein [Candidatus Sulfotelmatobacter sp.]